MTAVDDPRIRLVVTPTVLGWSVSGGIDASTVHILVECFRDRSLAEFDRSLTIDVGEVDFIDSSGLRALVNLADDAGKMAVGIVLRRPSPQVVRLLSVTGLDDLFEVIVEGGARRSFHSELRSIPTVRDFVRRAGSALHDPTLGDLELVASELATNAVRHGAGGQFDVAVDIDATSTSRSVSVSVRSRLADADQTADPRLWRRTDANGLTGRGLAIVESVSEDVRFAMTGDTVEVTSRLAFTDEGQQI